MKKFTKSEKKKCKFYDWGKCKSKINGKDCKPITKLGITAETIEECKGFEKEEDGK